MVHFPTYSSPTASALNCNFRIFGKVFFEVCYNLVIYIQREEKKGENDLPTDEMFDSSHFIFLT